MIARRDLQPLFFQFLFLLAISGLASGVMNAATFEVTRVDDPPPDGCLPSDCSLREAVIAANENAESDTVLVPAGTYTLTIPPTGGDDPESGSLDITDGLIIQGAGARDTVVEAGGLDRVFDFYGTAYLAQIDGLTVQNGARSTGGAGGILNRGAAVLTISNVTVAGNTAPVDGGGLALAGQNWLIDSTVTENSAGEDGGGIQVVGWVRIINSTISTNWAGGGGGGIHSQSSGSRVFLRNTTIAGNVADVDDDGSGDGGGLFSDDGSIVELGHTVIANNLDLGGESPDCLRSSTSTLDSVGFNLIGDTTGCSLGGDGTGNLLDVDPLLRVLFDWGGPTDTHAPEFASPVIDAGNPAGCTDSDGVLLTHDQRGYPRHQDGDGDLLEVCDMGAVEAAALIFADGFESGDTSAWSATVQ